jgi:hypothetical protein
MEIYIYRYILIYLIMTPRRTRSRSIDYTSTALLHSESEKELTENNMIYWYRRRWHQRINHERSDNKFPFMIFPILSVCYQDALALFAQFRHHLSPSENF